VELRRALAEVFAGRRYVSPFLAKSSHRVSLDALHPLLHRLTPRQQEVLCLLGGGKTETQIAGRLHLVPSTITFHKGNIQRVLGLKSRRALMGYAVLLHGCFADRNEATTEPGAVARGESSPATVLSANGPADG
jgi:DNA-binding NarL/FixJ family response regulator